MAAMIRPTTSPGPTRVFSWVISTLYCVWIPTSSSCFPISTIASLTSGSTELVLVSNWIWVSA